MSSEDEAVKWLRRRIEERRFLARHAVELGANPEWTEQSSGVLVTGEPPADSADIWFGTWAMGDSSLTRLMEANDPLDTIARCEAELAILDEHAPDCVGEFGETVPARCQRCIADRDPYPELWKGDSYPCRTVSLLASGYRHQPGYAEAWGQREVTR